MQSTQIDQQEFRAVQRSHWNEASKAWREWSEFIDHSTAVVSERLVVMAGVQPGHRVLDVAAGYGEPSLTAARTVGAQGEVVATDISAGMLEYGRERAAAAQLQNVRFIESDGEDAAARVRSFLKPGARMAISSWGPPERVPFMALPMATVMKLLEVPPPPPGTPGPMSRPTPAAIGGLLEGGGFSDIEVDELEVTFEYDSAEEFTRSVQALAPPITNLVKPHPNEVQQQVWQAVTDSAREHASDDGSVRLTNLVLVAAGRA